MNTLASRLTQTLISSREKLMDVYKDVVLKEDYVAGRQVLDVIHYIEKQLYEILLKDDRVLFFEEDSKLLKNLDEFVDI